MLAHVHTRDQTTHGVDKMTANHAAKRKLHVEALMPQMSTMPKMPLCMCHCQVQTKSDDDM